MAALVAIVETLMIGEKFNSMLQLPPQSRCSLSPTGQEAPLQAIPHT